ncbi:tetratricopeptide repeat protein [Leptolyngbya sp. CCY15150]|uniref:tetratricopeptide repeat protein n=1 Tax=Leptolyngbya sp. CCY15150 TaxID=2767772 RepID=UPI00194E2F58|nr:tetratricopeptide repeat protein [Leptolyngbya sp. CCY15150]
MNAKTFLPLLTSLLVVPVSLFVVLLPASRAEAQVTVAQMDAAALLVGANRLLQQGIQQYQVSQFQSALQSWQKALELYQDPSVRTAFPQESRQGEGNVLRRLGNIDFVLGQYDQSIDFYEQALEIAREMGDRSSEGSALSGLGNSHAALGQYQQAIDFYEQALEIAREIGSRDGEGSVLDSLGNVYQSLGQYQQAIDFYEQALEIAHEIGSRFGEGSALSGLGSGYVALGQYQQAIDFYEQALEIAREIGSRSGERSVLDSLGNVYQSLGQYQQAIDFYEQALEIAREIGSRDGEGSVLANLGNIYQSLGQYQQAIDFYEQALEIAREIGSRWREGSVLDSLGNVYQRLGQYQQAIDFYEQALEIAREIGTRSGEGSTLSSLGRGYMALGQYQQAIDFYEQALEIAREIGSRWREGSVLDSLGNVYGRLGQHQQAIDFYKQSLAIAREIGARVGEGSSLGGLANAYSALGQYQKALEGYQQALTIAQEIGNRSAEGLWLSNIGFLLAQQNQPELAIVFYKQSVNVRESIRADIRGLPQEQQQTYTETIAGSYRALADLLLQQNRILEAQRVLDLLRVQELDDYLDGVRSTAQTESGIDLRDPEQAINNRVIAVGYELAQLRDIPPNQLSDNQLQRLSELDMTQREMSADFQGFLNSPEIQALVAQLDASLQEQDILARADEFINLQNNLRAIDQNAVMIYPLILEDRLELVVVTPFSEPARYPVPVDSTELNAAIVEFRQALDDPTSDPRPIAQQLYDWLIAPMEDDLEAIGAETILYAPDGALRYIPLAALHDGDQWLIENYRINHITAASLQNFTLRPSATPLILAAAFSEGAFDVQIGQRSFSFAGLPFAGVEVENLVAAFPDTTQLMNDRFSRSLVEPLMDSHTIVHLATHAAFVPGSPADSFILFGNGDRLSLQDIRDTWQGRFNRVELIVLSACETGVGDALGNGEEILGFGYLMQEAGASAAIASLWAVSDGGTQTLMDAFYANLNQQMTKAEALRQAQIALITGDLTASGVERGASIDVISTRTGLPIAVAETLSHPYYWAPFILIGNGL